jgi:hypothetical protein
MIFAPEGHKYEGFTQYLFEGKELEFLEILLAGKNKKHSSWCCKSQNIECEFCPNNKCLTKGDVHRLLKKLRQINRKISKNSVENTCGSYEKVTE